MFLLMKKTFMGQNTIYYSYREGHINLWELFIEKVTDVNLEDKFGQTCIFTPFDKAIMKSSNI